MIAAIRPRCLHCKRLRTKKSARGLCYPCWSDSSIRPLYPPGRPGRKSARPACCHCGQESTAGGARGLGQKCYRDPAVRALYPCRPRGKYDREPAGPPPPERQPGDGTAPCCWCRAWRCEHHLTLCVDCQAEYHRMVAAAGPLPRDKE